MKNKSKASEFSEYLRNNYPATYVGVSSRKLICGVGINDSDYGVSHKIDSISKMCPAYNTWKSMLTRCYGAKRHETHPTYKGVTVCDEWLTFSNFRKWWIDNHKDDWQLDKDLLVAGNKVYSPETCIYVPRWLNSLTISSGARRGKYKIGVNWNKAGQIFYAWGSAPKTREREYLGRFHDETSAYNAWLTRKLEIALELKLEMDEIDLRIYPNVVKIIKNIT